MIFKIYLRDFSPIKIRADVYEISSLGSLELCNLVEHDLIPVASFQRDSWIYIVQESSEVE